MEIEIGDSNTHLREQSMCQILYYCFLKVLVVAVVFCCSYFSRGWLWGAAFWTVGYAFGF